MNINKTLHAIENHLAKHRGVGHTTVMLKGVENGGNCIVVSVDKAHAMILRDMTPESTPDAARSPQFGASPVQPFVGTRESAFDATGRLKPECECKNCKGSGTVSPNPFAKRPTLKKCGDCNGRGFYWST